MAKGGRYLNTNKKEKKKGKGLKILMIVVLVLALLIGGGIFAFNQLLGSMLGNVNRAEVIDRNEDLSYEDLMNELYGDMEQETSGQEEQEDVYIPSDVHAPEGTEASVPVTTETAA